MAYVLAWIPRIMKKAMVYATRRKLILQATGEASRRFGERLAHQEHG